MGAFTVLSVCNKLLLTYFIIFNHTHHSPSHHSRSLSHSHQTLSLLTPGHPWSLLVTPGHPWSPLLTPPHPSSPLLTPPHPSSPLLTPPHPSSLALLSFSPTLHSKDERRGDYLDDSIERSPDITLEAVSKNSIHNKCKRIQIGWQLIYKFYFCIFTLVNQVL